MKVVTLRRVTAFGLVLALIVLSVCLSNCGTSGRKARVLILGMDGLEWDVIDALMAEGKLPNFQRMVDEGTSGKLKSIKPILSPVIWTSIATGVSPSKHEITFFTVENPQTGDTLPITSDLRKRKALWNIVTERGRSVGAIGWWASWPAERVSGFMISDHANYHFLHEEHATKSITTGNTYPPDLYDEIVPKLAKPLEVNPKEVRDFLHLEEFPNDGDFDFKDPVDHFRWAYATARSHEDLGLDALRSGAQDLLMVYFEGPDTVSHLFGQYYRPEPERAATMDESKQMAYGRIVEQFYVYCDSIIGNYLAVMPSDMNLIVCSDHGFNMAEGTGISEGGAMEIKRISERAHKIYGALLMLGPDIKKGNKISGAHVYDIAPTTLALMGLPVAEDMDGRVLQDVFSEPIRVAKVPTFEGGEISGSGSASRSSDIDPEILEKLGALGYIGGESSRRLSNLGNITLEEGNLDKALEEYEKVLAENPDDPSTLSNIGTVYARRENYEEAEKYYRKALEKNERFAQGYCNLGLVCERTDRPKEAIENFIKASVLDESLKEASEGLERIQTKYPPEEQAVKMVKEAEELAKNKEYEQALERLDAALDISPAMPVAYQYESNIYYLMGKKDEAREALESALALDPGNMLFRKNLEALSKD